MSKPKNTESSYDAFTKVDELVSKPVLGSDGAASWQEFRKDCKPKHSSAAPKAPLKKADKLGTGLTSWEEERANEEKVRKEAGLASTGFGYTNFKKKNSAEEAAERKRIKQIEARIRPDNKDYFIPAKTFQGWKFDYIFTTRPDRGTGYFWDGMDSIKRLRGELVEQERKQSDNEDGEEAPEEKTKPNQKKRKKNAGPTIIHDPNNPLEQVAALLQKRNQMMGIVADPTLPSGWEATRDPFSGKTYYFCRATGERRWEKPQGQGGPETNCKEEGYLKDGWKSAKDPTTGKTYYYHANGDTRWEKPS